MICLSRSYKSTNIFANFKTNLNENGKKRWNLYPLIEIKDGMLKCQNEEYSILELCSIDLLWNHGFVKCTLNEEIVNLDPFKFELCHDYSFWQTESNRCFPQHEKVN